MKNVLLTFIFIGLIAFVPVTSFGLANTPWIPPTNAFDKIHTNNGSVFSKNYSMPLNIIGGANVTVQSNNATHTVIINSAGAQGPPGPPGMNGSGTITGSQNIGKGTNSFGVLAKATPTLIQGKNITCSTGLSCSGNLTDITILNTLTQGIISLNFTTNNDFDFHSGSRNVTYTTLDGQVFNLHIKPNVVLTNGSAQTIIKALTLSQLILGGNADGGNFDFTNLKNVNASKFYQNGNQVIDTLVQGSGMTITGSGNSRTLSSTSTSSIITSNATVKAQNYTFVGVNGTTITGNNSTHTVIFSNNNDCIDTYQVSNIGTGSVSIYAGFTTSGSTTCGYAATNIGTGTVSIYAGKTP